MIRNTISAAWRAARRDRFYALLNVLGLGLGFAAAILIWLFVRDELSYNHFLPGYRDVYRAELTLADPGTRPVTFTGMPARMAAELRLDFPEIAATTRTRKVTAGLRHNDVAAIEEIHWADPDFFKVLGYPMLRGDPATALAAPESIVLTQALALKYFGTIDCIGQTMLVNAVHPVKVTGVAADIPSNATKDFTVLISGNTGWGRLALDDATPQAPGVLSLGGDLFVRLRPGASLAAVTRRLPAFVAAHYPDPDSPRPLFASMFLHSLADVHLHPYNPDTGEPDDQVQTLYAISAMGLFVLALAASNFVNLLTARASRRAVEVGVRKGLGALRSQLMAQFLGESVAYALAGLVVGVLLAALLLPRLNAFLDRQIAFDFWRHAALAAPPVAAAVLLGLAAGVYPALILSRLAPVQALKGGMTGSGAGGSRLRQGLVVFQFSVTIVLAIATLVVQRQIIFATTQALQFDKRQMLTIDLTGLPEKPSADGLGKREAAPLELLRNRLAAVPGVEDIAATFTLPLWSNFLRSDFARTGQGAGQPVTLTEQPVDFGYFGVYRVALLAGRDFSRAISEDRLPEADKSRLSSAVINETARRALGFADAAAALGQEMRGTDPDSPRLLRIIGVAPDFPLDSVRAPVPPTVFVVDPDLFKVLSVRLGGADLPATLARIDAVWHDIVPGRAMSHVFLDDRIAGLYREVERQRHMFAAFAGFAITIGCLGLIGLSAYTAERRTREIGIRKAFGASAADVLWLMVTQFVKPVLLATLLAWPFAWWGMRIWLDGFAYRIGLSPWPFVQAGLGALLLALAATGFQAWQMARSRPALVLRAA